MSVALVIVLVVAFLTLVIVGMLVFTTLTRVRELRAAVADVQEQLRPLLEQLRAETAKTQRELARVSNAAARLRRTKPGRPTREQLVAGTASATGAPQPHPLWEPDRE